MSAEAVMRRGNAAPKEGPLLHLTPVGTLVGQNAV